MHASAAINVVKRLAAVLALAGGVVAISAAPASALQTAFYVNHATGTDSGTCPSASHACKTISFALSVAGSGATVHVAAGTYPESLTIDKSVTIVGAGETQTIIEPTSLTTSEIDTDSDTPQAVIVYITPGVSTVNFSRLQVNGSSAASSFNNGCTPDYVGIYYRDASGSLNAVEVSGVEQPADFGCQPGANGGVYVASDLSPYVVPTSGNGSPASWVAPTGTYAPSTVTMSNDKFNTYDKNGVTCADPGTTCTVSTSKITGVGPTSGNGQNGILVWGATATLMHDNISGNTYTAGGAGNAGAGILVLDPQGALTVSSNKATANDVDVYAAEIPGYWLWPSVVQTIGAWTVSGNTATHATDDVHGGAPNTGPEAGYGDGIQIDSTTGTVSVTGNNVSAAFENGISLLGTTGVLVKSNSGSKDYDGIYVGGPGSAATASTANTVEDNSFKSERHDGILADKTIVDSGNSFISNVLKNSFYLQAQDTSSGAGTDGTANTWTTNTCTPVHPGGQHSDPVGLC